MVRLVNWTVLSMGLSLVGFACSSDSGTTDMAIGAVGSSSASGGAGPGTGGTTTSTTGGIANGTGGQVQGGGVTSTGGQAGPGGQTGPGAQVGATGGTASGGMTNPGATGNTGTSGMPGTSNSCGAGLTSGAPCDPTLETMLCDQPTQTCECTAGQWACTPKTAGGMGGAGGTSGGDNGMGGAGGAAAGGEGGADMGGMNTNSGPVAWGEEENPSADCPVPTDLPGYGDLSPESKLPDPFMMLDGTRITSKSQWACRRQELLHQVFNYIYGEKPIPAEGSVTGSVSSSMISVQISEGGNSASFNVSVDMNGATAPAPAIIYYDGGLGSPTPIPSGVAKIRFSAIESQGGSGAKTGPFYDFYGSDHPAGYMVAQAWQVSRIIDLLQQDPSVIDPKHIGVTGCSRNGKGAFAAGVFDNRIALTIPCESGIGGTVGLRLKEQLDPGDNSTAEWPYHAISYVRWLSEVALGPFATSNDANGDNTDRLPVDMHDAMALIAPRAIYIVDNPGISNLDPKSAYVTGMAGKAIFEALGVGDHFAYQGASGSHCQWRGQYDSSLNAMIDRFLKGNDSTQTGNFDTDLGGKPDTSQYFDWDASELEGDL